MKPIEGEELAAVVPAIAADTPADPSSSPRAADRPDGSTEGDDQQPPKWYWWIWDLLWPF